MVNRILIQLISNAEKLTSRFWVLNRTSNGSFQGSFLFKSPSKNREVIFRVRLSIRLTPQFDKGINLKRKFVIS